MVNSLFLYTKELLHEIVPECFSDQYLSNMWGQKNTAKGLGKLIILFIAFHIFWLVFYILSESTNIKPGMQHLYFKSSILNTLGFLTFCLAAFFIFPFFISKQKYLLVIVLYLVTIVGLGYLQYIIQDWQISSFIKPSSGNIQTISKPGRITMPAVTLQQAIGAPVRAMLNIMVYLLLGTGYAYMKDWFIKDRRTRILEKEKIQAELTLLRYQLNPHFLFNTINDIYYLAIIKSDKTADAILKVSNLLRYVLNDKEEQVPLEKEIDHLKEFIKLQKFRFPDQFISMDLNIKDNIINYQIAPLLLITFVENAFKHGEPGTSEDPVKIHLSIQDKLINYTVINKINFNGPKDATTGIGLTNLKRRVSLLYPERHYLVTQNDKDVFSAHLQIKLS
jgi:two-component system, LytTR family, sensor kinase